jgi:hypothetical protein
MRTKTLMSAHGERFLILSLSIAAITSCTQPHVPTKPVAQDNRAAVEVNAVNEAGLPLAGLIVEIRSERFWTQIISDATGRVELECLSPEKKYQVQVHLGGYQSQSSEWFQLSPGETRRFSFTMKLAIVEH